MWGRQDQDKESRDLSFSHRAAAVNGNGNGRKRSIPQRPPRMAHIDQPPASSRVARPKRVTPHSVNWRRRILIWGVIVIVCSLLACGIGYAAVNFIKATNATSGAAVIATNFLSALSNQSYDQAYNDLDAAITVQASPDDFKQDAQTSDRCYGVVTDYSEVANSAFQNTSQSYSYSFTITRKKLSHPYTLRLTLQQDNDGNWKISSFGNNNDLGPGQLPCS